MNLCVTYLFSVSFYTNFHHFILHLSILPLLSHPFPHFSHSFPSDKLVSAQASTYGTNKRVWGAAAASLETDATRALDNQGLLETQREMMRKQEDSLESFLVLIQRQKQISIAIGEELNQQKLLLDDLESAIDTTNSRMGQVSSKIGRVSNSAKIGGT